MGLQVVDGRYWVSVAAGGAPHLRGQGVLEGVGVVVAALSSDDVKLRKYDQYQGLIGGTLQGIHNLVECTQ